MKTVDERAMDACRMLKLPTHGAAFFAIQEVLQEQNKAARSGAFREAIAIAKSAGQKTRFMGKTMLEVQIDICKALRAAAEKT